MRTSHLINNKSPILQHHERRQSLHNSHLIRKILHLAFKCVVLYLRIASAINVINQLYASIPQFYPSGGNYRLAQPQKLLPEGKPHLNTHYIYNNLRLWNDEKVFHCDNCGMNKAVTTSDEYYKHLCKDEEGNNIIYNLKQVI